jgi:hypothetical protein
MRLPLTEAKQVLRAVAEFGQRALLQLGLFPRKVRRILAHLESPHGDTCPALLGA